MNEYINKLYILNARIEDVQSVNSHVIDTRQINNNKVASKPHAQDKSNVFKDLIMQDLSNGDIQKKIKTIIEPLKSERDALVQYLNAE